MTPRNAPRKAPETHRPDAFDEIGVSKDPWPNEPRIDAIVNRIIRTHKHRRSPGVAVAVRKDRDVVHLGCYGYANLETGEKITHDTIFDLGSLSKQFTALAAFDLLYNNKLKLDDPLSRYFKNLPRYADAITIEDLIHHTSALPAYTDIYVAARFAEDDWYDQAMARGDHWYPRMKCRKRKELTNKDVMDWVATQKLLPRDPDIEFEYSNTGYVVLAELVEKASKMRFADYVREVLFDPLDMNDSYVFDEMSRFSSRSREVVNHAKCYNRVGTRFVPVGYTPLNFITGDGNLHSTIKDLLRWELNLAAHEIIGLGAPAEAKDKALGSSLRDLLWSPVLIKGRKRVNYGAGWELVCDKFDIEVEVRGKLVKKKYETRAEYHRGEWLGWRSYFARASKYPVPRPGRAVKLDDIEGLAIIVLSNADFGDKEFTTCRIAKEISKLFWGKSKKDNLMNRFDCEL